MRHIFVITCFLLLSTACFASDKAGLTANAASIDITPPIEMKYTLGGYGDRMNKPAVSVHDPIVAKALALKKGNRKYLIITLDVLGLPTNVKVDLLKRITANGWTAENVMLFPSHSHGSLEMAALNSRNLLNIPQIGIFQPELLKFVVDKLETLANEADRNYREVRIGSGCQVLEGLNRNRRKDPDVDKEMTLTRIDLKNGKPLAVLVNWTAHPTFLGGKDMQVSAEWPGYLQSELQNQIEQGVTVMYYNGAEGDQSAVLNHSGNGYEKIEVYGKLIAEKAFVLYKTIKTKKELDFRFAYQIVQLPKHQAHPSFMKTGGEEYGMTEESVKVVMNMLVPTEVGIGSVRVDDLIIAGVPGEMTAILGKHIKSSLKSDGAKYVTIGGLANEWISYILNNEQYTHGEGYESSVSFFGPELGDLITTKVIQTTTPLLRKQIKY